MFVKLNTKEVYPHSRKLLEKETKLPEEIDEQLIILLEEIEQERERLRSQNEHLLQRCIELETERQRYQELFEFEQAKRRQAEAQNRAKDEFLAIVSHELRTPLTPIIAWSGLLSHRQMDSATVTKALETIERNAKMQAKLIDDLLDLSRMNVGKLCLNHSSIQPLAAIEAAVNTVRPAADAKGIQIETVLDTSEFLVSGDLERLQQVVWNLLSNSIKFTPTGGCVEVSLHYNSSHAEIQVKDTGKGIKAEFLPYVFDRFRQGNPPSTGLSGGLGLGLAIARQLVELHGGTINADSAGEGQGSTFTVQIPLINNPGECQNPQT